MRRLAILMVVGHGTLLSPAANGLQGPQPPSPERYLELGIRQVTEGSFEEAVFTLDTAVRRLMEQPGRTEELIQAYLYLGAGYVGLDHEDAAKGKFREALKLDPETRLSEGLFPPRVIELFDEQVLEVTVSEKKRSGRRFLIIGGLGAGAAVGVATVARGTEPPSNRDPTASISALPERAIVDVTTVTFTASADDPDGDPLTYAWDLGDGTTSSGYTVTHVYHSEAAHPVSLTVTDGHGGSIVAEASFVARTLSGRWRHDQWGDYDCAHNRGWLECRSVSPGGALLGLMGFTARPSAWGVMSGSVTDPFALDLEIHHSNDPEDIYVERFTGAVWPSLTCMELPPVFFHRPGPDPYGRPGGCSR